MSELFVRPALDPPAGYVLVNIKSDYRRLFPVGQKCAVMTMPLFLALPSGRSLPPQAETEPLRAWKQFLYADALIFHDCEWVPVAGIIGQLEEMDVFARRLETAHRMLKSTDPSSNGAYQAAMNAAVRGTQDQN